MKRGFVLLGIVAGLLVGQTADAAFRLRITDVTGSGGTYLLTDQDFVPNAPNNQPDGSSTLGKVLFDGNIGNFNVTITGTSKPKLLNNAFSAELDLNGITVTNEGTSGGTLRVELTDTDFNINPAGNGLAILTSKIGGTGTEGS